MSEIFKQQELSEVLKGRLHTEGSDGHPAMNVMLTLGQRGCPVVLEGTGLQYDFNRATTAALREQPAQTPLRPHEPLQSLNL